MNLPRMTARGRLRRPLATLAAAATALLIAACSSGSGSAGGPATSAAASGSAASGANAPYTVTFGYISSGGTGLTGPWGYAYSKGLLQQWLKSYGITLKLAQFANGPLLTAAMVGGSVDMGVLGDTPTLIAVSQGLQARLVSQPELGLVAWIVAQPSVKTLDQLAGKTLARQQGSYLDRYAQGILSDKGLLSQVKLVAMLSAQATPAFEAGSLDAMLIQPTAWPQLQSTGKKYNILAKSEATPSLQGTTAAIVADRELAAHPNLGSVWNTVRVKSVQYATANASAYYAWAAAQAKTTVAMEQESAPLSTYPIQNFTDAGIKQLQGTLDFLVAQKEAKPFSIQSWELQEG
ncbi:MAG TPA: ABC transporter substrate-binding protein [Trebonia sp.]|nr:ABC transporter substrate-binding protein [Trebonia sp.]